MGFVCGLFLGGFFGTILVSCLVAGKRADNLLRAELQEEDTHEELY